VLHSEPFHRSAIVTKSPELVTSAPTAEQADPDEHPMPLKNANCAPEGFGVGWICHRVPSHRSARVPEFEKPDAVHDDGEVQATPSRPPPPEGGFGVCWMRHLLPSHRSARIPRLVWPTAVQADGAVHHTPLRTLNCAPEGFGVGWICHRAPFHRSARVTWAPEPVTVYPTAVHEDDDVQATAVRKACGAPAGFGVGWMPQLRPSHRSTSVRAMPAPVIESPTAVQADGVVQATPASELTVAPGGFGVGWMRHRLPSDRSASVTPTPEAFT